MNCRGVDFSGLLKEFAGLGEHHFTVNAFVAAVRVVDPILIPRNDGPAGAQHGGQAFRDLRVVFRRSANRRDVGDDHNKQRCADSSAHCSRQH